MSSAFDQEEIIDKEDNDLNSDHEGYYLSDEDMASDFDVEDGEIEEIDEDDQGDEQEDEE